MSVNEESSPLEIIRNEFWRHTERNPYGDDGLLDIMDAALRAAEEPASSLNAGGGLAGRLVNIFDSQADNVRVGLVTIRGIEAVGRLPLEVTADRAEKWGAIAFLGMLAMTYNSDLHRATNDYVNPVDLKRQLVGAAAQTLLRRLKYEVNPDSDLGSQQYALADALLQHSRMPYENVGIELTGLIRSNTDRLHRDKLESTRKELESTEEIQRGVYMGEPRQYLLFPSNSEIIERIDKMDWMKSGFDFLEVPVDGYAVYHDGQQVAELYDFTVINAQLENLFNDLKGSDRAADFWQCLAKAVVDATQQKADSINGAKVAPTYAAKRQGRNDRVLRAYFTPLGTKKDGIRRYALLAAYRTKQHQKSVFKLLSTIVEPKKEA